MNQGGDRVKASGFTIVETLIVLTVSALLLGSALLLISGKQNKTEFQTGINNLQQRIQQLINETVSGYYPSSTAFSCQASVNSPLKLSPTATPADQGTNGDCVFLGKAFRFGGGSFDPTTLTIYPIAANRLGPSGQSATSFAEARPTALAQGTKPSTNGPPSSPTSGPSLESTESFLYGLSLKYVSANGSAPSLANGSKPFVIAVLANPSANAVNGALQSGSEQFGLYGFGGWSATSTPEQVVDNIDDTDLPGGSYIPLSNVQLCFASGGTNQTGLITISSSLSVSLQIKGTSNCL